MSLCTFHHLDPPLDTRHMYRIKHSCSGAEEEGYTKIHLRKRKDVGRAVGCLNNENASFITVPDVKGAIMCWCLARVLLSEACCIHSVRCCFVCTCTGKKLEIFG